MTDLINEILATLRHNKMRTLLTGLAVSWGIFLLIVLLSVSHGFAGGMHRMFAKRDTQAITVTGGYARKSYQGLTDSRRIKLKESDKELIASQSSGLMSDITSSITNKNARISTSNDYADSGYKGVDASAQRIDGLTIAEGRFINDNDLRYRRRVIVISDRNARTLFGTVYPIGQSVKMNSLVFTVVGIYTHQWENISYIPYSTARSMAGGSQEVSNITVRATHASTVDESLDIDLSLYSTLGHEHRFAPDDGSALSINNRLRDYLVQSRATGALDIAVWIIGLLTLLSGIVGVSNIMFVSVRERTHEIGVRRAIGARPASILRQIILESVAITTLFGYLGIIMGIAMAQLISKALDETEFYHDPGTDLGTAVAVTLVLIVAGGIAGLFPALKSLKIKPVEALRDE